MATISEIVAVAKEAHKLRTGVLRLEHPPGPRPRGFPRGKLVCVNYAGSSVYEYSPIRVLRWLAIHGFLSDHIADNRPTEPEA